MISTVYYSHIFAAKGKRAPHAMQGYIRVALGNRVKHWEL
jgi:hypothetical protein